MTDLDTCPCGGRLVLERGTDPEDAEDGWFEVYRCLSCRGRGLYGYDPRTGVDWSTGVCV